MNTFIQFLVFCNFAVALVFAFRRCVSKHGVEINHVLLFTTGFLFYWVLPIAFGLNPWIDPNSVLGGWDGFFSRIAPQSLVTYLGFSLGFYLAFCLGTCLADRVFFLSAPAWFVPDDVRDAPGLAAKLLSGLDAVSQHWRALLPAADVGALRDGQEGARDFPVQLLVNALNVLLSSDVLERPDVAAALQLREHTEHLAARRPGGQLRLQLRRVILQELYPAEIVPRVRLRPRWDTLRFTPNLLTLYLLPGILIAALFTVSLRGELFRGYAIGTVYTNQGTRSTFIACSVFLLSVAFVYTIYREPADLRHARFGRLLRNKFVLAYLLVAILVLSLGGRLYFLSSVCMLLVYRTVYFRRLPRRTFVLTICAIIAAAGVVGSIRLGGGVTFGELMLSLFSEAIGSSISLVSFLSAGRLELLNFPIFLMHDFINLLPSNLLPNKAALILSPTDYGYVVFAPLGAMHSAISFMVNFGMLGSLGVIFCFAFWLQRLRHTDVRLFRVMYVMISGWVGSTLFRDPFSISIVKTIFEFSILVPSIMVVSLAALQSFLPATRLPRVPRVPETVG